MGIYIYIYMSVTLLLHMRRHVHAFGITVYACAGMSTRSVLLYSYIIMYMNTVAYTEVENWIGIQI